MGVACDRAGQGATYPVVMARSHLTLAALATAAVEGLDVVRTARFGGTGTGDFDSSLLTGRDGRHWVIRVPRGERAEAEQSAELVALRALTPGVRARLPFAVSTFAGQVPVDGTRAIVLEFVYGDKVAQRSLTPQLGAAVGEAIAAIHSLPASFIGDAGLPSRSAVEQVSVIGQLVGRVAATDLVPGALLGRWMRASEDTALWQYAPTVVNGALGGESFLSAEGRITGVLGWHALRVDDPAVDLQWVLGAPGEGVADAAFEAYSVARPGADRRLRDRARLLSELELARWLLHGVQSRDQEVVDDAVGMMRTLVEELSSEHRQPITAPVPEPLGVDEVEELLERTPHAS